MASRRLKDRLQYMFSSSGWFDRAYLVDWAVVAIIHLIAQAIYIYMPIYRREIHLDDPLINHPFAPHERVPGPLATLLSVGLAAILLILGGLLYQSGMEVHHGVLGVAASSGLTRIVTEFLKNRIGRLRPDFLARCQWDVILHACTGPAKDLLDGHRSFPSGHSSGAFAGLGFLCWYLAGKLGCFTPAPGAGGLGGSRMLRVVVTFSPLILATWIAVTRIEDYRHHKEDIVVGSFLGFIFSTIVYPMYWHSPFGPQHGMPKMVYAADVDHRGFVLTAMDDEQNENV